MHLYTTCSRGLPLDHDYYVNVHRTTSFKFMRSKEEQDTNVSNYNSEEMKTNVNTGRKMVNSASGIIKIG